MIRIAIKTEGGFIFSSTCLTPDFHMDALASDLLFQITENTFSYIS